MTKHQNIALIGVGLMGHGIAKNLSQSGYTVHFLDHPGNQNCDDLLALGAKPYQNLDELIHNSTIVILCVTGSTEVEAICFNENGLLGKLSEKQILINLSTIIPDTAKNISEQTSCAFLDGAMTRTPKEAEAGRLNVLVGGDEKTLDEVYDVLDSFSEHITHTGDIGTGSALKLIHNYVSLSNSVIVSEATAASRKMGINDKVLIDTLSNGGGGSTVLERLKPYIQQNDVAGFLFSLENCAKDLGYYEAMVKDIEASSATATQMKAVFENATLNSSPQSPIPYLIDIIEKQFKPNKE